VQKVADRQGKKRWCYNLRNQIWRPLRCFQEKISCWPRYKEFWLSHTWVISAMVLKHPRGLQIRMKCFKKRHVWKLLISKPTLQCRYGRRDQKHYSCTTPGNANS
jgi:hypothetical protein